LVTYIDREGSCWNYTITSDCTGLFPHRFDSSDLCKACEESRAKSTVQVLRQLRHQQFRESVSVRRRFSFFFTRLINWVGALAS